MNYKISVVVPVYCHTDDHETYRKEALESIANQTLDDIELIVIDDVSPRDISHIIQPIRKIIDLRYIRNTENIGHAKSRNAGILEASADLIAFLDHDDIWLPNKLEEQYAILNSNPDAEMVFCGMEMFGENASRLNINQEIIPEKPDFLWFFNHGNYTISASAVLVRKQAMLDIGLFDSRYTTSDDFDAWLKIAKKGQIIYLPKKLAKYRLHQTNVNYCVNRNNDTKLLFAIFWDYWNNSGTCTKIKMLPRMMRKIVGRIVFYLLSLVKK